MAVIHKLSTQVLGGRDSNTYLGNKGDIVLDPTSMTFYYHDGSSRGGTPIIGSGGSAVFQQLALVGNQLSITGGNTVDLTAVGFSGDYNDLANAPIIPPDRPDQTLTLTGSTLAISNGNSIELGSMLFSGSYDDLTNKPTIPVDQTLTLSGNTITISGSSSAVDLTPILGSGSGGTSLPNGSMFATLSWNGSEWVSSIPTAQYIYSGTSDADAELLMNLASGGGYPSGSNPAPQGTLYWNRLNQVVRIYTATGWQDLGGGGGGSETLTTLSLTGTDLDYTDENGTLTTIDLSPFLPITETVTSLSLSTNILKYTDETGTDTDIDLSLYIDDTNLARLVSGTVAANGMATFTRDDTTTFDVDFSNIVGGSDTALNSLTFDSTTSALAAGVSDGNSYSVDLSTLNQQAELDATQVGAGLLDDGSYVVPDGFVPAPTTRDQGNNGEGLVATPNQLTDNLGPDRFFPTDVGSTVTITSGTQAGTYTIVSFIDQNNVTVDGSGWTADFSIASYTVTAPAGAAARPGSNYLANTTSLAEADLALDAAIYAASNQYIDDLLDVDTTTTPPANNDVLAWDGTNWVPATPASGSGTPAGVTGNIQFNDNGAFAANSSLSFDPANNSLETVNEMFSVVPNGGSFNISADAAPLDTTLPIVSTVLSGNQVTFDPWVHYSDYNGVALGASQKGRIFKSTDNGATFTELTYTGYTPGSNLYKWVREGNVLWGLSATHEIYVYAPSATTTSTYFGPQSWWTGNLTAAKSVYSVPSSNFASPDVVFGFDSGNWGRIYIGSGRQLEQFTPASTTNSEAIIDVSGTDNDYAAICTNGTALLADSSGTYTVITTGKNFTGAKLIGHNDNVNNTYHGYFIVYQTGAVDFTTDFVTFTGRTPAFVGHNLVDAVGVGLAGTNVANDYYTTLIVANSNKDLITSEDFGQTWQLQDNIASGISSLHMMDPDAYGIYNQDFQVFSLALNGVVNGRNAILTSESFLTLKGQYLQVEHEPIKDLDIANKKYVDDRALPDSTGAAPFSVLTTDGSGYNGWADMSFILGYGNVPLTAHADVSGGQSNGDILSWNGSSWVPGPAPAGGSDTFTNAAAIDANNLVMFTRNDGNTHTLDLDTLDNRVAIGNTAPTSPVDGDLWYDELTSRMFVYAATSWVDASPATTDTNTFTNAAAIDANNLVTFTRSDGNTYTLDLASVGGATLPDGDAFGQLLWWNGGSWTYGPAGDVATTGFQFDGYTGRILSRQFSHWYDTSIHDGSGANVQVPTESSFFRVTASSNTTLSMAYSQHANVISGMKLEVEISGGASVTLPSNVIIADNTPSVITGDGKYLFEIFGRNGATNTYLKGWSDPTYAQVSGWKSLGTTTISNNSMNVVPYGFANVGEVFAYATEGMIVVRDGTEYTSSSIPSAAVAAYPATFPIYKGGSLLASMTFTSATDTIFDVTIHSADEVKVFYR